MKKGQFLGVDIFLVAVTVFLVLMIIIIAVPIGIFEPGFAATIKETVEDPSTASVALNAFMESRVAELKGDAALMKNVVSAYAEMDDGSDKETYKSYILKGLKAMFKDTRATLILPNEQIDNGISTRIREGEIASRDVTLPNGELARVGLRLYI